jgi:hypothetical protein
MKKIIFTSFLFLQISLLGNAQSANDSAVQRQSYLFDHFINGSVLLKTGGVSEAPLNYSSIDQSILFEKDNKIFTLTELATIDTIYIASRKFVPHNNIVYEVLNKSGKVSLYITYTNKLRRMVATTDHNGSSKQDMSDVSNNVSDVYVSRPYKGDFSVEITKHYWLKSYNNIHKANNAKDFLNVFKESTHDAIINYLDQHPVDFRNQKDLVALTEFCNQL